MYVRIPRPYRRESRQRHGKGPASAKHTRRVPAETNSNIERDNDFLDIKVSLPGGRLAERTAVPRFLRNSQKSALLGQKYVFPRTHTRL